MITSCPRCGFFPRTEFLELAKSLKLLTLRPISLAVHGFVSWPLDFDNYRNLAKNVLNYYQFAVFLEEIPSWN